MTLEGVEKIGVLLINLGGPGRVEEIRPFLYNLFADVFIFPLPLMSIFRRPLARMISYFRAKKVRYQYEAIGGGSPILALTRDQAGALSVLLNEAGEKYKVAVAMRYSSPFIHDGLRELADDGIKRFVIIPLFPQYCRATTLSCLKEVERFFEKKDTSLHWTSIDSFFDQDGFVDAVADTIRQAISGRTIAEAERIHLLFTAHNIPESMVADGDPYLDHVKTAVAKILDKLSEKYSWSLAFQSRVGPMKWLSPKLDEALEDIAQRKPSCLLMIPVSFVCDHLETLFELDVTYMKKSEQLGFPCVKRTDALNSHPIFIRGLKQLIEDRLERTTSS